MGAFYFPEKEMDFQPRRLAKDSVQRERAWRESWEGYSVAEKLPASAENTPRCGTQHVLTFLFEKKSLRSLVSTFYL